MASASASSTQDFQEQEKEVNSRVISKQDIEEAIAKTIELRALHSALLQGNSPASTISLHSHQFSAHDYPIFTPSYEDDPLPGYKQLQLENHNYGKIWDEYGYEAEHRKAANMSLGKGLIAKTPINLGRHASPPDDQKSVTSSCTEQRNYSKARRNSLDDLHSVSSCNKCKPAIISSEADAAGRTGKSSNIIVPLTDSHISVQLHGQKTSKGLKLSWLFPKQKKKSKIETDSEEVSHIATVSIETLKKELMEANESRDAALMQVSETKSCLGELKQKLDYLETYCEELKKSLRQAIQANESPVSSKLRNFSKPEKSIDGDRENLILVSEDVMLEGFSQIVSESRLSVKQFCKTLIEQIEATDNLLTENVNLLLQPYKLSLDSKYSEAVVHHIEAIINQSLFQDFDNCVFQKNGSPKHLDPQQDRHANLSSFVALRNLSWDQVLRKGTKYYSQDFSKFCDQKMSCIIATLSWTRPWPEQLLQAFFVAAKCIWLLHLLVFSFNPPLRILRVEENGTFDIHYMEDVFVDKQRSQGPSRVKVMVMPGFYVHDRVLKCKVICRYKTVA